MKEPSAMKQVTRRSTRKEPSNASAPEAQSHTESGTLARDQGHYTSGDISDQLPGNDSRNNNFSASIKHKATLPPIGFQNPPVKTAPNRAETRRPRFLRDLLEVEGAYLSSSESNRQEELTDQITEPRTAAGSQGTNPPRFQHSRTHSVSSPRPAANKGNRRATSLDVIVNAVQQSDLPAYRKLRRLGLVYQDFRQHPELYDDFEFSKMRDYITEIADESSGNMYLEGGQYNEGEADFEDRIVGGSDSEGSVVMDFEKPMKPNQVDEEDEDEEEEEAGSHRRNNGKMKLTEGTATKETVNKSIARRKRGTKSELEEEEDMTHETKDSRVITPSKKRNKGAKPGAIAVSAQKIAGSRRGRGQGSKRKIQSRSVLTAEHHQAVEDTDMGNTDQDVDTSITSSRRGRGSRAGKRGARRTRTSRGKARGGRRGGNPAFAFPEPERERAATDFSEGFVHSHAGDKSGIRFPHNSGEEQIINSAVVNGRDRNYIRDLPPKLIRDYDYFPANPLAVDGSSANLLQQNGSENSQQNVGMGQSNGDDYLGTEYPVNLPDIGTIAKPPAQNISGNHHPAQYQCSRLDQNDFANARVYATFPSTGNYTLGSYRVIQHAPPPDDNFGEGSSKSVQRDIDCEREALDVYAKAAVADSAAAPNIGPADNPLNTNLDPNTPQFCGMDVNQTPVSSLTLQLGNKKDMQRFAEMVTASTQGQDKTPIEVQASGFDQYFGLCGISAGDPYMSNSIMPSPSQPPMPSGIQQQHLQQQQQNQVDQYRENPSKSRTTSMDMTCHQDNDDILDPNILNF